MIKSNLKTINELKEILKKPSPNLRVRVYDVGNKRRRKPVKNKKVTLNQRMDRLENKVDQLGIIVEKLTEEMRNGFKQVNARLDYIVKANDLKDSK